MGGQQEKMDRALARLGQSIHQIMCVDLMKDSFEVLKESNGLAKCNSTAKSFSDWLEDVAAAGIVYQHDLGIYRQRAKLDLMQNFFAAQRKECWQLRYRMQLEEGLQGVLVKAVPAEDYSEQQQVIYLYFLDVDQDETDLYSREENLEQRAELEQTMQQQYNVLYAMASSFMTMHLIDLPSDTNYEFKSFSTVRQYSGRRNGTAQQMREVMSHVVMEPSREEVLRFTELSTLEERMRNHNTITCDFLGMRGWMRCAFTAIDYTDDGRLWHVVFTTREIDDEKRHEAKLARQSRTDEMTNLYNRRAYEEDVRQLEQDLAAGKIDQLGIVSVDVNGLRKINAELGHEVGDSFIEAASFCVFSTFCNDGECYRMDGDEFSVILKCGPEQIKKLLAELEENISGCREGDKKAMHLSYGAASLQENPGVSIAGLAKIAEEAMYRHKSEFYSKSENDRRESK